MSPREWLEVVLLEKVVHAHPEQLGNDADVVSMVKLLQDMDALTSNTTDISIHGLIAIKNDNALPVQRILGFQLIQSAYLNRRSVAVLLDGTNDFDGYTLLAVDIHGLDDLAERALAE